jgi:hypothetical protein
MADPADFIKDYKREIDKLTDMLCRLIQYAAQLPDFYRMPNDICDWYEKHKEFDKKRNNTER